MWHERREDLSFANVHPSIQGRRGGMGGGCAPINLITLYSNYNKVLFQKSLLLYCNRFREMCIVATAEVTLIVLTAHFVWWLSNANGRSLFRSLKSCSRDGGVIRLTSAQTQTTTEASFWGPKTKQRWRSLVAQKHSLLGTYEMHERPRHWSSSPASKKTCAKNMALVRPATVFVVIAAIRSE